MRLDFNENTVGCSPRVAKALKKYINRDRLATYPEYESCRARLAAAFGRAEEETLITNGTDEAIQLAINTFVDAGERVIISEPTFAMYRFYAELAGAEVVNVAPADDLVFPVAAVREDARLLGTRAVLIANPNNPTGTAITPDQAEWLARELPQTLVFVDEAYFDFYDKTALLLVERYENLMVSRTFSKAHGLAAMRIGCLFAHRATSAHMRKAQSPYSVNAPAAAAALEAICDREYIAKYVAQVNRSKTMLERELRRRGIRYVPSKANFILAHLDDRAHAVRDGLRERGILARDRSSDIAGTLRFTLGTPAQTRLLIRALGELL